MAYIYCIRNDINEKVYIGKTVRTIKERFQEHIKDAHMKKCNSKLHRAILKYGQEHFSIELIEQCNENVVGRREKYYIQLFDSVNNGYNISYGGGGESQVDIKQLEDLFLQGYNFKEISDITGHTQKTVRVRLKSLGYVPHERSDNRVKNYGTKAIEFEGKIYGSITLLAEYLQANVEPFTNKQIETIIKGISKNSKKGTKYCGYYFHRL